MAASKESVYPSVFARQKSLKDLNDPLVFSLDNLETQLKEAFRRLTASVFPDDFESDLNRLLDAPISQAAARGLKNYAFLMQLARLIENPSSSAGSIINTINLIEDQELNKDLFYDLFITRLSNEIEGVNSIKELKKNIELVSSLPQEKKRYIFDVFFIKSNCLLELINDDVNYIAETLSDLADMQEVDGIQFLISNLSSNLIHKVKVFEMSQLFPEEIKEKIGVLPKESIQSALSLLQSSKFSSDFGNFITENSLKFGVISRVSPEETKTEGNTPVHEECKLVKSKTEELSENLKPVSPNQTFNEESKLVKSKTGEISEKMTAGATTPGATTPGTNGSEIPQKEESKIISSKTVEEIPLTLSTTSRQEFECSIEEVKEIMIALPIKSWDQIKTIERIIRLEEKGMEVIKAVITINGQEKLVAVKTMLSKFKDPRISMQAEYMALVQDHPNFLTLYGAFWETYNKKQRFTIVMELAEETLTSRIRRWDQEKRPINEREFEVLNASKNLVEAMMILNKKDISHRDIKPDNIFITRDNVYKIADFDVSRKIERDSYGVTQINSQVTISGTKNFMSPELNAFSSGMISDAGIDYNKSDVYSLGLTLLRMVTSKNFLTWNVPSENLQENMYLIIEETLQNQELKKILKAMLVLNPDQRPKFREIHLMSHMQEATVVDDDYF
jgi:hypothetical protein